ncbi:MAG TPA: hypothetical protein VEH84_03115 [Alphaproteobacteria bacterium]|nr:hypothetical protein [Alphaproteobacteria bacterium]
MNKAIEDLYAKAAEYFDKYKDQEMQDYLMGLARKLEDADMLRHQFGYFLMHAKSTIAYPVRPKHFQEAVDRAERYLKKLEEE